MNNNEKFLKSRERKRQVGKVKFIVSNILMYSVISWILIIIYNAFTGYEFSKLTDALLYYIAGLIGVLVGYNINWYKNENKYCRLLRKR